MPKLRQDQFDTWLQAEPDQFIESALRHIVETMPEEVRGIPLRLVVAMIEVAVQRARRHGLQSDSQVMGFVAVMFEVSPNFDEQPVLRAILSGPRLTPAQRWEAIFANTTELSAAWERAAHPNFYDPQVWIGT